MKSELPNKKMFSFKRLRKSFVYAGSGIKASLKREQNLKKLIEKKQRKISQ